MKTQRHTIRGWWKEYTLYIWYSRKRNRHCRFYMIHNLLICVFSKLKLLRAVDVISGYICVVFNCLKLSFSLPRYSIRRVLKRFRVKNVSIFRHESCTHISWLVSPHLFSHTLNAYSINTAVVLVRRHAVIQRLVVTECADSLRQAGMEVLVCKNIHENKCEWGSQITSNF